MKIVINGAGCAADIPASDLLPDNVDVVYVDESDSLAEALAGAEVLVGWAFRSDALQRAWHAATDLKWVHCCSAGVDAVMFPALQESDVIVTNSRGLFDRPMAEYLLGYMLSETKRFGETHRSQQERTWDYQPTAKLAGQSAVIFGVGSIGRDFARVLSAMGVKVCGVGRTARSGDADFGEIYSVENKLSLVRDADWIVAILPSTPDTQDYFDGEFFKALPSHCRFVNMGRGTAVDEVALHQSLNAGDFAGAMLDVFKTEPLPQDSPLWSTTNLMVSPHMSGDYDNYHQDIFKLFLANLQRYQQGQVLNNIVDKMAGFVPSGS